MKENKTHTHTHTKKKEPNHQLEPDEGPTTLCTYFCEVDFLTTLGSAVNSSIDQGEFVAMKTLIGSRVPQCDKHQFCDKMTVSTSRVFKISSLNTVCLTTKMKTGTFRNHTLAFNCLPHSFWHLYEFCWQSTQGGRLDSFQGIYCEVIRLLRGPAFTTCKVHGSGQTAGQWKLEHAPLRHIDAECSSK